MILPTMEWIKGNTTKNRMYGNGCMKLWYGWMVLPLRLNEWMILQLRWDECKVWQVKEND